MNNFIVRLIGSIIVWSILVCSVGYTYISKKENEIYQLNTVVKDGRGMPGEKPLSQAKSENSSLSHSVKTIETSEDILSPKEKILISVVLVFVNIGGIMVCLLVNSMRKGC